MTNNMRYRHLTPEQRRKHLEQVARFEASTRLRQVQVVISYDGPRIQQKLTFSYSLSPRYSPTSDSVRARLIQESLAQALHQMKRMLNLTTQLPEGFESRFSFKEFRTS